MYKELKNIEAIGDISIIFISLVLSFFIVIGFYYKNVYVYFLDIYICLIQYGTYLYEISFINGVS